MAECAAGGEKEVALLASQLRIDANHEGRSVDIKEITLDRQCIYEFIDQLFPMVDEYDAILSLGCGAGVQAMAEVLPNIAYRSCPQYHRYLRNERAGGVVGGLPGMR